MSTAPAVSPLRRPIEAPERRLHVVAEPDRKRRPKLLYGMVALLGAFAIAGAQMALSVLTTQTSYDIAELTSQQRNLTYEKQILTDELAGLSSPQYLAANAAALGMVIDETPAYLRLSDGAVIGASEAAGAVSTVDAIGRGAVENALISETPLVTAPDATIAGDPVTAEKMGLPADTPLPVTDGLPTPATR
ncbi:MAG TPA: hypothetical protein DCS84_07635 [Microbacterium sp.]|nr:hypothetical protein [Microbacterium sp.]